MSGSASCRTMSTATAGGAVAVSARTVGEPSERTTSASPR